MSPRRAPRTSDIVLQTLLLAVVTGCLSCATTPTPRVPNGPGSAAIPDITKKLGLQLYSVRAQLETDVPGTLNRVHEMGFHQIEVHKTMGLSYGNFRSTAASAQLAIPSMMSPFDRLRDQLPEVIADAKAMGVQFISCPWIPHEELFDSEDATRAIAVLRTAGTAIKAAGMRLVYHIHGYELRQRPLGETDLDQMIRETESGVLDFEMDVFYMAYGGANPVAYLETYPGRFPLLHLKDMRSNTPLGTTGKTDATNTVALGAGIIDFAPIIRAAEQQGTLYYFVEDESAAAADNLPRSLAYLKKLMTGGPAATR